MDLQYYVGPYVITKILAYAVRDVADTASTPMIHKVCGAHLKPYKQLLPEYADHTEEKESMDQVSIIRRSLQAHNNINTAKK